jgi:orotate phosphoribosyltransferase
MTETHPLQAFRPFIRHSPTAAPIGRDGRIRVNYFLDLMSAVHQPELLDCLAEAFANYLKTAAPLQILDGIVAPKRGNALLAKRIAQLLGKRSGFVKENILFGQWIEGNIGSGDRVVLIDDVASDGELLAEAATALQRSGVYTDRIAVFVCRPEGDTEKLLARMEIEFGYCLKLSDSELGRLHSGVF